MSSSAAEAIWKVLCPISSSLPHSLIHINIIKACVDPFNVQWRIKRLRDGLSFPTLMKELSIQLDGILKFLYGSAYFSLFLPHSYLPSSLPPPFPFPSSFTFPPSPVPLPSSLFPLLLSYAYYHCSFISYNVRFESAKISRGQSTGVNVDAS